MGSGNDIPVNDTSEEQIVAKSVNDVVDIQNEHWLKAFWEPCMAWLYMFICLSDFIVFPLLDMLIPFFCAVFKISPPFAYAPWQPITLTNGGFIHITFGGVLGIARWRKRDDITNG